MKIVFLADLHGNWPATQAMAEEIKKIAPDEIVFLGDAVGKGPQSDKTCDWVRENCRICVGGNWDYGIGGKQYSEDAYFWNQLGEERMAWLNNLPLQTEMTISGIRFRLFHGRPVAPLINCQTDKEVMKQEFTTQRGTFGGIIFADSHRPFVRTLDVGYIMNTGSVGNSLGVVRAHALLVEGEKDTAEPGSIRFSVISVPYDVSSAVRAADENLPHREEYIRELTTGHYSRK